MKEINEIYKKRNNICNYYWIFYALFFLKDDEYIGCVMIIDTENAIGRQGSNCSQGYH